jgi:fumarate reductase subunit C
MSKSSWFLTHARYKTYMLREVTCIAIAGYMVTLILGLMRLSQGPAEWTDFISSLHSPAGILFQIICLALSLYNTVSWFQVTPKAMPIMIKGEHIPGINIIAAHYLVWIVVSAAVLLSAGV